MDHTAAYHKGIALFNAGEYWHAHEAWESCWLAAAEPERTLYKGLIQAAAALVHWQRGNERGLHRNWAKGRPRLVALGASVRGVALQQLISAMDRFVIDASSAPLPCIELLPADVPSARDVTQPDVAAVYTTDHDTETASSAGPNSRSEA